MGIDYWSTVQTLAPLKNFVTITQLELEFLLGSYLEIPIFTIQ